MCGFFLTNLELYDQDWVNYFVQKRGPDCTGRYDLNGFSFIHNLLSMTGEVTEQPFIDKDIVCLFNGEIYNYNSFGSFDSDGKCIIPLYKEYGSEVFKLLDGEFSICIFDLSKKIILVSTDTFRTKPLWFAKNNHGFGIASYESALSRLGFKNTNKFEANSIYKYDLQLNLIKKDTLYEFDLKQFKDNYHDWNLAFERAIYKRYIDSTQKVFIGLSSGYDSGAISCALNKQNVDYHAYSTIGRENLSLLKKRHSLLPIRSKGIIYDPTDDDYKRVNNFIVQNVEEFYYEHWSSSSNYNERALSVRNDHGSNGLSYVCEQAKSNNRKIYLSGQGADEIFADYGFNGQKKAPHSNFGGLYPDDLSSIFPWPSFYGSSQLSYLMKEEHISGAYGLEGRYPYLDRDVVQEFLYLTPRLKNSNYKSVLHNYMKENNYPFEKDAKVGFKLTKVDRTFRSKIKERLPKTLGIYRKLFK